MDISRRKMFGLLAGAGSAGLASCATNAASTDVALSELLVNTNTSVDFSFDHGVASGDAVQDRVVLWTRITPAKATNETVSVVVWVSPDRAVAEDLSAGKSPEDLSLLKARMVSTSAGRDFTVKCDFADLLPDTVYFYRFQLRTPSGEVWSPIGKTRTIPATGGDQLKLGVISCSNWPFGFFNVYKALSERDDLDAIVHLGDYIYEYGVDGYGGEVGAKIGRNVMPATEIVSLEDYRTRHAQYKSDPNLQAAHAICPWYCTWDDHESADNSYRSGANNHNPENNEGDWTERKQRAIQAYFEWMPVREPVPGRAKEAFYRSVDYGDLATIFMLESRLTGRSDEIDWSHEFFGVAPEEFSAKAAEVMAKVNDPTRTMLGKVQEDWLDAGLKSSVAAGKTWQVLANQVILGKVVPPDFSKVLSPEQMTKLPSGYAQLLGALAKMGLPFNLDAWDGFPAARERLYQSALNAKARLVTFTGDTHTAWANEPHADDGAQVGVEFGCTSVTSPGMGDYLPFDGLGQMVSDANADVVWYDPSGHGYTLVTFTQEKVRADYLKVSTILDTAYDISTVASFEADATEGSISPLRTV